MKKKPLIPFSWMPGSWGLKGKTREIAQAEYELSGIDLEQRLIEINLKDDPTNLALQILDMRKKHGIVSDYDYDLETSKLQTSGDDLKLAILDIDLKYGKVEQLVYDRQRADILKEPWVSMPKIHWDPVGSGRTFFELDYNDHFLQHLKEHGYAGNEDDDVINMWLNDVCISITEEISGMDGEMVTPFRRSDPENPA